MMFRMTYPHENSKWSSCVLRRASRREFISLIGGAAAAWPLAARAQQAGKLPTIGFLGGPTPSASGHLVAAFAQRLRELGWIEGRTARVARTCGQTIAPAFEALKGRAEALYVVGGSLTS